MGEFLWTFAVQEVLKKALTLLGEQINVSSGLKKVLEGLQKEVLHAERIMNAMIKTNHYSNDGLITEWMNDLQVIVYEAEDMLDLFAYEDVEQKIRSNKVIPSFLSIINYNFSKLVFGSIRTRKMKEIMEVLSKHCTKLPHLVTLDHTSKEIESDVRQIQETTSMPENYVVGRKMEVERIVHHVIEASKQQLNSVLPVYGMGGSGKTTLAKLTFNDERIRKHFQLTVWICVSQSFDINKILQSFLQKVHHDNVDHLQEHGNNVDHLSDCSKDDRESLIRKLMQKMNGKRYFLVLDHVWNTKEILWEKLKECLMSTITGKGNCILVTTRSREIAEMMEEKLGSHHLKILSNDQCWSVFTHFANANEVPMTSDLEFVREELVKKIGGLPLLAKVLGAAVQFSGDHEQWVTNLKSILTTPLKEEEFVKFILKLSVDRLPNASIKQCFAYCSNFAKGYRFDKKQLIQMWMAQGFTRPEERCNETMEDTGERYFNILLSCCLFQDVEDESDKSTKFQMHDLIHDIACHVSNEQKLQLDLACHVSNEQKLLLDRSISSKWKHWRKEHKLVASKLRTAIDMGRKDMIGDFVCLRVLTFANEVFGRLPNSISELKHLRYLDISNCYSITKLPKSIVMLYNLQTLRLPYLTKGLLPTNFRRMVSLRHLEFLFAEDYHGYYLTAKLQMPPYLSQLIQLQTLSGFVVGFKKGRKITELGGLRNLKGLLMLLRLEHVGSKEEAKTTRLVEKENVEELRFVWSKECDRIVNNHNDLEVLEGLEPHKNLKYLEIQSFLGACFPNEIFVENLVKITLIECENCEKLPMLGQLTNLEILVILKFPKVESISGNEFYGNQSKTNVFPKLKELYIEAMDSLVQWEELAVRNNVKAFPLLECLHIVACNKLVKIPDVFGYCDEYGEKHLKFVEISLCDQLKELPNGIQSCHSIQQLSLDEGSNLWSFVTTTRRSGGPLAALPLQSPTNFFDRRNGSFIREKIRLVRKLRKIQVQAAQALHHFSSRRQVQHALKLLLAFLVFAYFAL